MQKPFISVWVETLATQYSLSGSKLDLMDAALNLENNNFRPKVWHTQHNQNNINQVEDVDRSSRIGKIIIGLVFLIILF